MDSIAGRLLGWYDRNARTLLWRVPPGSAATIDPYRVWLSEIMLQQTTVAAVIPYFERFTRRWPDVASLAAADHDTLMAAWAGLGYYARARNLHAAAKFVAQDRKGHFPEDLKGLLALPGVGQYTAAAIAAIAFGRRVAVVDANVERVAARLFAISIPPPSAKREIAVAVDAITPATRPGDFAQAMMDLGATICTVQRPACDICPLAGDCRARAAGIAERLPVKGAKAARPARSGTAWWIEVDEQLLLVQRPHKGLLGGMRALPDDGWSARRDGDDQPPVGCVPGPLIGSVSHVFTHFSLTLNVRRAILPDSTAPTGEARWWPLADIGSAGLPTLFVKAAALERRA